MLSAKSLQSCPTLCDPIDGSPPGSPVPGILQARTLEWVAISFSNAWKWKEKVKWLSCVRLLATPWTAAYQAPLSMGFSRQEYWSGVPLPSPLGCYNVWLLQTFFVHVFMCLCEYIGWSFRNVLLCEKVCTLRILITVRVYHFTCFTKRIWRYVFPTYLSILGIINHFISFPRRVVCNPFCLHSVACSELFSVSMNIHYTIILNGCVVL